MTHYPKLKRALIKANTARGHHHPSYQQCDDLCRKQAAKLQLDKKRLNMRLAKMA